MKKIMLAILLLFCLISVSNAKTEYIQAPYNFQRWLADLKISSTIPVNIYVYELHVGTFVCVDSFTATTGNFLQDLWVRGETVLTNTTIGGLLKATSFYFTDGTFPIKADGVLLTPKERVGSSYLVFYSSDETNSQPYSDVTISVNFTSPSTNEFTIRYGDRMKLISNANLDYFTYDSSTRKFKISNQNNPALAGGLEVSTTGQFESVITNEVHWPDGSVSTTSASGLLGGYVLKIGDHMTGDLTNDTTFQAHTGNFEEVLTSTIMGKHSPVYAPDGFKLADGTILTSTIVPTGFTSSSTARIPTVLIASNDSPDDIKAIANIVCDGVSDELDFMIAQSSIGYGKINLSKGEFYFSSACYITKDSITFVGEGRATVIKKVTSIASRDGAIFTTTMTINSLTIRDMALDGQKNILGTSLGLYIFSTGTINNLLVDNCYFKNFGGGIYMQTSAFPPTTMATKPIIRNNVFYNDNGIDGTAIRIDYAQDLDIYNNNVYNSMEGYHLYEITGNNSIVNNKVINASLSTNGFYMHNVSNATMIGNTANSSGNAGFYITGCQVLTLLGNKANSNSTYGFYINGLSGSAIFVGNEALNNGTANVVINPSGFTVYEEANTWDSHSLKVDGSNKMTANLDMGGYDVNHSPVVYNSTNIVAGLVISTNSLLAQTTTNTNDISLTQSATGYNYNQIQSTYNYLNAQSTTNANNITLTQTSTGYNYNQIQSTRSACLAYEQALTISTNSLLAQTTTNTARIASVALSTGNLQFVIGVDSVPAVNDYFGGIYNLGNTSWSLQKLCGFIDTPATGSAFIADLYLSNSGTVLATITIPVSCSSGTVVNISSTVASGLGLKGRIRQIGSTIAGSDFRVSGVYTK